jgi:hypothetical protein
MCVTGLQEDNSCGIEARWMYKDADQQDIIDLKQLTTAIGQASPKPLQTALRLLKDVVCCTTPEEQMEVSHGCLRVPGEADASLRVRAWGSAQGLRHSMAPVLGGRCLVGSPEQPMLHAVRMLQHDDMSDYRSVVGLAALPCLN